MDGVPHLGRREYTIKAEELGHTLLGHGTQESHSSSSSIKFTQKTQIASSIAARLL
jgi:Zn-dependent peptidase ImmA (M78 family)